MINAPISAEMAAALALAYEHGGRLCRFACCHWSFPACPRNARGVPLEGFGHVTIRALVARGRMRYSRLRQRYGTPFPIEVEIRS
jgi:hypothetical protein